MPISTLNTFPSPPFLSHGSRMIPWIEADEILQTKWNVLQEILKKGGRDVSLETMKILVSTTELDALAEILDAEDRSLLCWALKGRVSTKEVIWLLLDSKRECLYTADTSGRIPLHIAVEQKVPLEVIHTLLETDVSHKDDCTYVPVQSESPDCASVEIVNMALPACTSSTIIHRTVLEQDSGGKLPLHLAVEQDADADVMKLLLDADITNQTVRIPDDEGNLPIHIALRMRASSEVIQLLLEADIEKKTISLRVLRLLIKRYPHNQDWFNNYMAEPLLCILLEKPQEPRREQRKHEYHLGIRSNSFEAELESDREPGVPVAVFPMLAISISKSRKLQKLVNEKSSERKVVAVFLEDLYANCILIAVYLIATDDFLNHNNADGRYFVTLLLLACYFLFREIVQVTFHQEQYLFNAWNFFDLGRIVLVLASDTYMRVQQQAETINLLNPEPQDEPKGHALLAWTGVVVFLGMISFLRSTILSFSYFVSGVFNIFLKLLPFFVGSALVLLTFAYLYFVDRFYFVEIVNGTCIENEDEGVPANFCTLESAFYAVYGYLIAGPEETTTSLDLIFGLVVVIILLNVLIAIVTTAWEKTSEHVAEDFWLHRISFLSERPLLLDSIDKMLGQRFETLLKYVDAFGEKQFLDQVPWEEKPYRFVWINRDYYKNPEKVPFDSTHDEHVVSEWREKLKYIKSYEADMKFAASKKERAEVMMNCAGFVLVYLLVFLPLGLFSFGYLWPRRFRMFLFGNSKTKESMYTVKREIKELKSGMETERRELKEELQEMRELLTTLVQSGHPMDTTKGHL